jgi:hypothetical protein
MIRGRVRIQAGNIDVNGFENTVEHFAPFFDRSILAAKKQFDVCVRFKRVRDVKFNDHGLLRKDCLGLLGKGFGIDGELMPNGMDDARGVFRDGELRESWAERIGKGNEGRSDVRGGGLAEKKQGGEDDNGESDKSHEDSSAPRLWASGHEVGIYNFSRKLGRRD